jgi:hypothetical protein
MPLQLDTFRNIADQGGHHQVLLASSGANSADNIKTRGSFASWVVNLFRGDGVRQEQNQVAEAFVRCLENQLQQGTPESGQLVNTLKADYTATMQETLGAVRRQLANQLDGTRALTTHDIRQVLKFVAEVQDETLVPLMEENRQLLALDQAQESIEAVRSQMADFKARPTDNKPSAGQHLANYLSGFQVASSDIPVIAEQIQSFENAFGAVTRSLHQVRTQIARSDNPQILQDMEKKLVQVLSDKKLVDLLAWFNETRRIEALAQNKVDTTTVRLGNGQEIQHTRTPRAMVDAFTQGEKLSAQDLEFLDAWANRFPTLVNAITRLNSMTTGEKDLNQIQNLMSQVTETEYASLAQGAMTVDDELLDGLGGVTKTPHQDQAVMALWDRRDELIASLQGMALLKAQARAVLQAGGDLSQLPADHVNPFREAPQGDDYTPDEPDLQATPVRGRLNTGFSSLNEVSEETTDYHAPAAGAAEDAVRGLGLDDKQKLSRLERMARENAQLGISADGKSRLPTTAATERHAQRQVRIDPQVEPGRSIPQEGKNANKGFDHEIGSGRQEAANPSASRTH